MDKINTLSLDLETFSPVSLKDCGVYKYAESDEFEILLLGYSANGEDVQVIDIASGEKVPEEILKAIVDPKVIKWAYNASFERICLSYWLKKNYPEIFRGYDTKDESIKGYLDPSSWRCSMIWAAYIGLPLSLEGAGAILKLSEQKLSEGKDLIKYFCVPCRPTKINGQRTRNLPCHAPDKWATFKAYNKRDVETEMSIQKRLAHYPVPDFMWQEYALDQEINDRGILVDISLTKNAIDMDEKSREELSERLKEITSVDNPNSVAQLKGWLSDNGLETEKLGKKDVAELIKTAPEKQKEVLELRQQLSKSSVKKYQAMMNCTCKDNRARGCFQFLGANRSGRWAGRRIQLQNLPQNHLPDLECARSLVKAGDYDAVKMLYGDVPDTLSQLIRTAFIPRPGYKFIISDFSAIEARVLSFLAGEEWRNEVFKNNGDIYCASASAMFKVPVEKHGQNSHLRQKGKIAELALGYSGSVGALKAMGALEMGLAEEELLPLVQAWRNSNPNIVKFWWDVDNAVKRAIKYKEETEVKGIKFICKSGMLFIELPSCRRLSYVKPHIIINEEGREQITYEGTSLAKKWERIESYGPKFVENITQAISRDILAYAMKSLSQHYICGHVHDELIIECPEDADVKTICKQMATSPPWLPGIILNADGFEAEFYQKD